MTVNPAAPIKHTTIHRIREDLRSLWASESMSDEAVIRARTHNLVVYVADDVSAEQTTRRIIERTGERPGRVIIIDVDSGKSGGLDAWVTTYCRTVHRHQICGEMITLTTSPEHQDEVHSTVISLLAPDLPVYLWWTGLPDPGDELLAHLAPAADRVLVDSDTFDDCAAGFAQLAAFQQKYRIGDLAWARLSPWRQLLAQLWDVNELHNILPFVRALDIQHLDAGGHSNPGRVLLLLGWLAVRLGWSISRVSHDQPSEYVVQWQRDTQTGQSRLTAVGDPHLKPGEIRQVSIEAGKKSPTVTLQLDLFAQNGSVQTQISDGKQLSMKHSTLFRAPDDSLALAEELDLGYDPSYAAALQTAAHLLEMANVHLGRHKHARRHKAG